MFKFTIGGKSVSPDDLGDALTTAVTEQISGQMCERLRCIRDAETGEFPTVLALGDTLDHLAFRVEGSARVLELVRRRFSSEELGAMKLVEVSRKGPRKVFLSHALEDQLLAKEVAETLQRNGIDTWWAEWSMKAGDSLRQKVDEGLRDCTHFLVLLTPTSLTKPWVNAEIDAGFIRKIQDQVRFIPLRANGLKPTELPPLLQGMLSPAIENFGEDIQKLVHEIYDISRKPPLGPVPAIAEPPQTGYSPAATAIAKIFVEHSSSGQLADPQSSVEELVQLTGLSEDDVKDGLYELHGMVEVEPYYVWPRDELFASFDRYFMDWDPAQDALRVAADIVNDADFPNEPPQIAARYDWPPRRMNPAIAYLKNRQLISCLQGCGTAPWLAFCVERNDATRRFVKSRS